MHKIRHHILTKQIYVLQCPARFFFQDINITSCLFVKGIISVYEKISNFDTSRLYNFNSSYVIDKHKMYKRLHQIGQKYVDDFHLSKF